MARRGLWIHVAYLSVIVVLLAALFSYHMAYGRLSADYEELKADYQELADEYGSLSEDYERLQEDYQELWEDYQELLEQPGVVVQVINDRDYYPVAKELVEVANESIYVVMFYFKYDPRDPEDPVNELIWAMGNATLRGVELHVILEDSIHDNVPAYNYFARIGANVTFDKNGVRTHCKLIVIDRLFVLVGSHNWTESALWWNHEASVLIRSREVAEAFIRYFNEIWAEASGG
ncbi:phospholipase [Candidatus Bathyarchaeota archaeon]|nr:MAG: phospholipase [Candidatus Bathyarchaeota archaeon]